MSYQAFVKNSDGTIRNLQKGDTVTTFRNEEVSFLSVTHPRKVYVAVDPDWKQEFFASVIEAGIWDDENEYWTFSPDWDHPDDPTILGVLDKIA